MLCFPGYMTVWKWMYEIKFVRDQSIIIYYIHQHEGLINITFNSIHKQKKVKQINFETTINKSPH